MPRVALPPSPVNNLAIVRSTRTGGLGLVLRLEPYWRLDPRFGGAPHASNFRCWTYDVWFPNDSAHSGRVGPAAIEVVHNEDVFDLAIARIKATPDVNPMNHNLALVNNVDIDEDDGRINMCLVPMPTEEPWLSTIQDAWSDDRILETNLDAGNRDRDDDEDEDEDEDGAEQSLEFSFVDGLPWLEPATGAVR
jgi:hypothetical protein